ncbi:Hypothetical protein RBTH_03905 [Bacillus thuringiensis serovar israelensis ATCC 35646]|nr:Hypothetical protein RBTH_03905 [Bacillus thuringiensis serovar israelensis ATCC 35646]
MKEQLDILKMKNQQYYTGNVDLIANVTIKNIQKLNNKKKRLHV